MDTRGTRGDLERRKSHSLYQVCRWKLVALCIQTNGARVVVITIIKRTFLTSSFFGLTVFKTDANGAPHRPMGTGAAVLTLI